MTELDNLEEKNTAEDTEEVIDDQADLDDSFSSKDLECFFVVIVYKLHVQRWKTAYVHAIDRLHAYKKVLERLMIHDSHVQRFTVTSVRLMQVHDELMRKEGKDVLDVLYD